MPKVATQEDEPNDARNRLMLAALRQFADKGFEGATTREICEAAAVNISAIRYYFGDKAGLYRAVFREPLDKMPARANRQSYLTLPINEALDLFFADFLTPFTMNENVSLMMKLHCREMLEPTGVWQETIESEIKPQHATLVTMLRQHLGLAQVDLDLHRLAFAIVGMAIHSFFGQEVITAIAPPILNSPQAIEILAKRLSSYALAMVASEAQRRSHELTSSNA